MKKIKNLKGMKIDDEDAGTVSAVFSTFNIVDSDGDVTEPGAFTEGAPVLISAYNHTSWQDKLPIGKGVITSNDDEAILKGQFFLDTQAGRETFTVLKGVGGLQEWSYGYDVIESEQGVWDEEDVQILKEIKVHEVSPVILGAGVDTRTLAIKSGDKKFSEHATSVVAEVDGLIKRAEAIKTLRQDQGKSLGEQSTGLLAQLQAKLEGLIEVLTVEPKTDEASEDLAREYAHYVCSCAGL